MKYRQKDTKQDSAPHWQKSVRNSCRLSPTSYLLPPTSYLLSTIFCLLFFAGCMSLPKVDLSALKSPGPVTTVMAAWEPAVSNGENPERGFGGRVYFYDSEQNRPVRIKGTVVVYAFDEEGRDEWDARPNEGFVFDNKTLNSRGVYAKSRLGHSYNLWIPLDEARPDSPSRKISLIVRYIPERGSSVVSSQTTVHLPGRRDQERLFTSVEVNEFDGPGQQIGLRSSVRSIPERARLTEEHIIESADRQRTMQAATIR